MLERSLRRSVEVRQKLRLHALRRRARLVHPLHRRLKVEVLAQHALDGAGAVVSTVEHPDALPSRVVDDGVGILAGGNIRDRLERPQVEGHDLALAAAGNKTAVQVSGQRHSVHPFHAADFGNQFSGIGVHHHDTIRACDVSPARVRIDREIIPAPDAAKGKSIGDLVYRRACNLCGGDRQRNHRQAKQDSHAYQTWRFP